MPKPKAIDITFAKMQEALIEISKGSTVSFRPHSGRVAQGIARKAMVDCNCDWSGEQVDV